MGSVTETGSLYSQPVSVQRRDPLWGVEFDFSACSVLVQVGFIFVFNLIVGAGVLAMPKAFGDAGWLSGTIFLVILCFLRCRLTCTVDI